jgi:phosphate transport system substrate-binding protein
MNRRSFVMLASATMFALTSTAPLSAQTRASTPLSGSGSTFAAPLYQAWSKSYFQGGPGLSFNAIGSAGGLNEFQNQVTDFAGSDAPMTDEQIGLVHGNNKDVMHIPSAYGGIVVTYNLPGNPRLNLNADQIAGIYLGQIKKWNDSRLVATNPSLAGVDAEIITFHRSEGSGTTFGFTSYLSAGNADWRATAGADLAVTWPVGDRREGNGGVVKAVTKNLYSIGYADYNFVVASLAEAQRNNKPIGLAMASLYNSTTNGRGSFVQPTLASIGDAVTAAAQASGGSDLRLGLIFAPGAGAYPLTTATYIIVHQHQVGADRAAALRDLLLWGVTEGQREAAPLNYVPLPPVVQQQAARLIRSIDGNAQR